MKYWLSHLPCEVWVDVFRYPGKSRVEMGRIVDRYSNRKFVEYLQFYLHDWGKRKLNNMEFKQEFLSAQTPCTFALSLINLDKDVVVDPIHNFVFENWEDFDEFHLTNSIGEELHGQLVDCDFQTEIRITRHRANCGMEMREWIEKENRLWVTDYRSQNHIDIDKSTTIGLLDGMDAPEDVEEAQQQQKPSTSKEA